MLCITVYQTTTLVIQYLDYPVELVIDDHQLIGLAHQTRPESVPYFLSLTVCNLDPFPGNTTSYSGLTYGGYLKLIHSEDDAFRNNTDYGQQNRSFRSAALDVMVTNVLTSTQGYFAYLGREEARLVGASSEDFIVGCKIAVLGGQETTLLPCTDMVNIKTVQIPRYFNCFTLEAEEELLKARGVSLSGYSFVLHTRHGRSLDKAEAYLLNSPQAMEARGGVSFAFHKPGTSPPIDVLDQSHTFASGGLY